VKPHEETWKRSHLLVVIDEDDGHDLGSTCFGSGALPFVNHDANIARLTLAAQAPAMARLLVDVLATGEMCRGLEGSIEATLRAAGVVE
jgi:hypothetical protein